MTNDDPVGLLVRTHYICLINNKIADFEDI